MKINLGSDVKKKSFFPIQLDSSTSTNFGEVQPTFTQEVVPNSTVSIDIKSFARLAPLSKPTFGACSLKHYIYYVKFSDIWKPFTYLLSQKPYSGGQDSYIPHSVPTIPLSLLWHICFRHSLVSCYKNSTVNMQSTGASPGCLSYNGTFTSTNSGQEIDDHEALNMMYLSYPLLFNNGVHISNSFGFSSSFSHFKYDLDIRDSVDINSEDFVNGCSDYMVTLDGADYVLPLVHKKLISGEAVDTTHFFLRLNDDGKRLRKIFLGLGYKLTCDYTDSVSLLPILAYYKCYFDAFAPKRNVTWESTSCAKFINAISASGHNFSNYTSDEWSYFVDFINNELFYCYYTCNPDFYSAHISGGSTNNTHTTTLSFLNEFGDYDDIEADISSNASIYSQTNISNTHINLLKSLSQFINKQTATGGKINEFLKSVFGFQDNSIKDSIYVGSDSIPINISDVMATTEVPASETFAGQSLGEYAGQGSGYGQMQRINVDCKEHGIIICLSTVVPRTQYVNGINPCLLHKAAFDYYTPMLDGKTLVPTHAYTMYCPSFIGTTQKSGADMSNVKNQYFGNIPIYSEYKTKTQGVLNGDLSLHSTIGSYDSFTMDKVIADGSSVTEYQQSDSCLKLKYNLFMPKAEYMTEGVKWNYIGATPWIGRYNRLFVNNSDDYSLFNYGKNWFHTQRTDDNIIVHNVIDLKINAPMLPMANSFDTHDENSQDGITVEKV